MAQNSCTTGKVKDGIDLGHIALILDKCATPYDYSNVIPFKLLTEITPTVQNTAIKKFADNQVQVNISNASSIEIAVATLDLDQVSYGLITGASYDANGVLINSINNEQYEFAFGYRSHFTDGTYEYIWYPRCTFSAPSYSAKTQEEGADTSAPYTMTVTAVSNPEGHLFYSIRTDDPAYNPNIGLNWFNQVYSPMGILTPYTIENNVPVTAVQVFKEGDSSYTTTLSMAIDETANIVSETEPVEAAAGVIWTSSDPLVVEIASMGTMSTTKPDGITMISNAPYATLKALTTGTATLTAKSAEDPTISTTMTITVA